MPPCPPWWASGLQVRREHPVRMSDPALAWLDRHTVTAPPVLRDRVRFHALRAGPGGEAADRLARASRAALSAVCSEPTGSRPIALDLLAADALITLALLAQAESSPDRLGQFAASLLTQLVGAA